jgi:hypothetical protein
MKTSIDDWKVQKIIGNVNLRHDGWVKSGDAD